MLNSWLVENIRTLKLLTCSHKISYIQGVCMWRVSFVHTRPKISVWSWLKRPDLKACRGRNEGCESMFLRSLQIIPRCWLQPLPSTKMGWLVTLLSHYTFCCLLESAGPALDFFNLFFCSTQSIFLCFHCHALAVLWWSQYKTMRSLALLNAPLHAPLGLKCANETANTATALG